MKYRLDRAARDEYREAAEHYLKESPRIAAAFVDQVEATIALIRENPTTWRVLEHNVRRCLVHIFPSASTIRSRKMRFSFGRLCTSAANRAIGNCAGRVELVARPLPS